MAGGDGGDLRQGLHAFEGLQHAAGVGPHQAVVVKTEIRGDGSWIAVEEVLGAVVQPEGVAGVEDAGAVVEAEDRVRPVEVGGTQKLQAVADVAPGTTTQIKAVSAFHRPAAERPVHLVLEELDRHLGGHDLDVGVAVDQITDQAGMVRFGVGDHQVIDGAGVDPFFEQREPGVAEFEMAGVHQGRALSLHQKGVVGGAVPQAELDVETAAVPVEGADGCGVGSDRFALKRESRGGRLGRG